MTGETMNFRRRSRGHVLYVAYTKSAGRSGLHRVNVPPMHGADIRSGLDVKYALKNCREAGLEPSGAVFSESDLNAAVIESRLSESESEAHLQAIDEVYTSIESASDDYARNSQQIESEVRDLYGRIGSAVARYALDVLPPRSVTAFGARIGITAPTMSRVLAQQNLTDEKRGVRWAIMARTLHTMGVLDDVADVIEGRVDGLAKARTRDQKEAG